MLQVKRWARQYLSLSPIFRHPIFGLPNNEHIMRVNPRLLTSYCLKMLKRGHYDKQKITSILQQYNNNPHCYWNNYVQSIIGTQQVQHIIHPTASDDVQAQQKKNNLAKISKLRHLISKTFHVDISKAQFNQLAGLYLSLLQEDSITEMDNFTIDLSLFELCHLTTFAEMKESALHALGHQSLALLQKTVSQCQPANYFSIISVLNRLKTTLNGYPQLQLLAEWVQPQADHKQLLLQHAADRQFLTQQPVAFMVWLVHAYEFGQFLYAAVRKNFLLVEYSEHSLRLLGKLLSVIQIGPSTPLYNTLLVSQIVYRLQQITQESEVFEQLQKNIALQKTLKQLKHSISQLFDKQKHLQTKSNSALGPIQLLQQLNKYQIDFHSPHAQKIIKQQLADILGHPHSAILLTLTQITSVLQLAYKIDNLTLFDRLAAKFKHKSDPHSQLLIDYLAGLSRKGTEDLLGMRINNICQLKRVKDRLQLHRLSASGKFTTQQLNLLTTLQLYLNNPKNAFDEAETQWFTHLFQNYEF